MLESKTLRVWFAVTLLMCVISCGEALSAQEEPRLNAPTDFRIGIGDVLQIDVWKQPEITRTIPVRPDGTISLPLINDVKVSGLSAMQVAGLIHDKLKDFIPNPQVTVTVTTLGPKLLTTPPQFPVLKGPPPVSPDLKQKCCLA
jgi:polysaccharide biosynthesis/export protein